jgi:hypothetical protein
MRASAQVRPAAGQMKEAARRPKAGFGGDGGAPLRDDGAIPLPSRRIQGQSRLEKLLE